MTSSGCVLHHVDCLDRWWDTNQQVSFLLFFRVKKLLVCVPVLQIFSGFSFWEPLLDSDPVVSLSWFLVSGSKIQVIPFLFPVQTRWLAPGPVQCWARMWLWRRVAEENLLPHCEQRSAKAVLLGGDEGDDVSMAALSAMWVWRWALRRDIRLNLRPHSSHSDQTLRLFFCTNTDRKQQTLMSERREAQSCIRHFTQVKVLRISLHALLAEF